jgi:hypothetical protein
VPTQEEMWHITGTAMNIRTGKSEHLRPERVKQTKKQILEFPLTFHLSQAISNHSNTRIGLSA